MNATTTAIWFTAGLTAIYVYLNYRMERLMARQFEAALRPYICVDVFSFTGSTLLKLRIRNLGRSAARNLRFQLDKDVYQLSKMEEKFNFRAFLSQPMHTFAPNAELIFNLGESNRIYADPTRIPLVFSIEAIYEFEKKKIRETTVIDLSHFRMAATVTEPLVEAVRKISQTLAQRAAAGESA